MLDTILLKKHNLDFFPFKKVLNQLTPRQNYPLQSPQLYLLLAESRSNCVPSRPILFGSLFRKILFLPVLNYDSVIRL